MSSYDKRPARFLEEIVSHQELDFPCHVYCAGFELGEWRHRQLSTHLIDWLPDYALTEDELEIHQGNAYSKLQEAAVRVYSSNKYQSRGEVGEISLHAICRDFFGTTPISPRVFYKSTSNDVIKAFDMVHARLTPARVELWLGESKLYANANDAVSSAIKSINEHLDAGFLRAQKLLLGPQIPKSTPGYEAVRRIFLPATSMDEFLSSSIFVVGIFSNAKSMDGISERCAEYEERIAKEIADVRRKIENSGLPEKIKLLVVYMPLATKEKLVHGFDQRLRGLQP